MIFDLDGTPPDVGFPDVSLAETEPNGLLAIGGDLSETRVLAAYRRGIFPWYSSGQPILWWSPAPRMVLYPAEFHVSRSLRKTLRQDRYAVSVDRNFSGVIRACASPRNDDDGTWLLPEMISAYQSLNRRGVAHSIEVWHEDTLAGGLYGIQLGRLFFGESMFSAQRDASKVALATLTDLALQKGIDLIDCQIHTSHLASLGAREIDREQFDSAIARGVNAVGDGLTSLAPFPTSRLRWRQ